MSLSPGASRWIKCISTQGTLRGIALQATDLVAELTALHGLSGVYAQGLGEAAMAALLISSYCKSGDRINLNIQGSGYFRQALVDAYPDGTMRGYVTGREAHEVKQSKKSEMGPWGDGLLSILRTKDTIGERPYIGTVPLVTGHLAKDLSFYWYQSEQVPSAVGLAVDIQGDKVVSAGGFLVQAMPGATQEDLRAIEQHIGEIQSLAERLSTDADPMHLLSQIFQSTAFMIVEEKPLRMKCSCSWERVKRALTLVGPTELKDMLAKDHSATIHCDFCTQEYKVDAAGLQELIDSTSEKLTKGRAR